ncbi:hypothetical protein PF005_g7146 [Phytophthora fragariae]|uniref:Uncharacterized protein n=2 Tax=Phytophthora fragariae TaxID=53985 RepID=A0A6A3FBP2_9STRA|nr:hypothetical protein PF009_g7017 [Phytophthora fragariae]KAE9221322.1 hypothetical protein PF005_g7146 [Phytophthora fragariae]KAE9243531.1 hypothetical protein PF004_g6093 [Phytophthora fragariae]
MSQRFCRLRETTLELTDNFRAYAMDIIGYAASARVVPIGDILARPQRVDFQTAGRAAVRTDWPRRWDPASSRLRTSPTFYWRGLPVIDGEAVDGRTKWLVDEYGIPVAHLTLKDDPNASRYDMCLGKRYQPMTKVLTTLRVKLVKFVPGKGEPLLAEVDDPHNGGKTASAATECGGRGQLCFISALC